MCYKKLLKGKVYEDSKNSHIAQKQKALNTSYNSKIIT